jgi:hypothetical protein
MPTETTTLPATNRTIDRVDPSIADGIFDAVFERSLHFRIQLPWEQALHFLRRIDRYNDFDAERVVESLERADLAIPRTYCGAQNPNEGQRDFTIAVGREGSPVIYLQRHEFTGRVAMQEASMKAIRNDMKFFGLADEADYYVDHLPRLGRSSRKITFRFWWD